MSDVTAKLSWLVTEDRVTRCSVGLLGHAAHLGADVAQEEEDDGRQGAGHFGDPEGHVPAVVLGDGAERESRQEPSDISH